jgi:mRNA interferase MazF
MAMIFMNRGEIWLINLEPTVGAEIKKTRPAVIVSDDAIGLLPLRVIVPVTEWKERYTTVPWIVKLLSESDSGLDKPSAADTFQMRSVSNTRFVKQLGRLSETDMQRIAEALAIVLCIRVTSDNRQV